MDYSKFHTSPLAAGKYRTHHDPDDSGPISLAAQRQRLPQYRAAIVEDMAHKALRLKTVDFRDKFFPLPAGTSQDDRPQWDENPFKELKEAHKMLEAEVSEKFIKALHTVAGLRPNLALTESQHCPDEGADTSNLKVDAGFFRPHFVPTDGRPHWADQIVPVEFKSQDTKQDPYDDRPKKDLDADAATRKAVRGQLITYAEEVFRYQHRTELYMLLILGRRFRFLRWDRSGTVVTPATDYYDNPELLCEMLWRMSLLDDEQLGLDPTAERIRPETDDFKEMDAAAIPQSSDVDHAPREIPDDEVIPDDFVFRYVRESFASSLGAEWPRYRLEVPHGNGVRGFLVGKPTFRASGMAGRGTRGYVALDCETGRFVWLKDAWRAHYELIDQEGTVLTDLHNAGVPSVPTLVCHGDVLDQVTKTPEYWEEKNPPTAPLVTVPSHRTTPPNTSSSQTLAMPEPMSSKSLKRPFADVEESDATLPTSSPETREDCPLRRHKHYRIVVEEVCLPLVKFESGEQLLEIILTCVIAHQAATNDAKIVHRDVSGGNILILPSHVFDPNKNKMMMKWYGLLVDWELSKPVHDNRGPPRARQPERTGTWQYMSVATLNEHAKVVKTSDELEPFFHVVLYYAVRYLVSNCPNAATFIDNFFDSYSLSLSGKYKCGSAKSNTMYNGVLRLDDDGNVLKFGSPLDTFLDNLLGLFKTHYAVTNYDKAKFEKTPAPAPPPFTAAPLPTAAKKPSKILDLIRMPKLGPLKRAKPQESAPEKPTEEVRELALQVQHHDCMIGALAEAIGADWPLGGDRVKGDNVPSTYTPQRAVGPTPVATSNKKARIEPSTSNSAPTLTSHHSAPLP